MPADRVSVDADRLRRAWSVLSSADLTSIAFGMADRLCQRAAAHAATPTDWPRIIAFYDLLMRLEPSPIVALNRAVAVALHRGPEAGLALMDGLADELGDYRLLHAARADMLRRLAARDVRHGRSEPGPLGGTRNAHPRLLEVVPASTAGSCIGSAPAVRSTSREREPGTLRPVPGGLGPANLPLQAGGDGWRTRWRS